MFKILVDGVEHSRYDENEWNYITVGSGQDATVRLPWADGKLVDIHPMPVGPRNIGNFFVEIHTAHGMLVRKWLTEELAMHYRDPKCGFGGRVHVRDGLPMTIMEHTIHAIRIHNPHPFGSGCFTCGQTLQCTCGVS
jgi:hypothetical protein